ncbi:acyl-coenzyme A thioesterase 13-like [Panicum miliaceum]|uniref:Acyl-coenzyme A thioesterase 13-like n=1 Tax=Panicum miliaceum TaxID=4540 RepID=A0A3L6SRM5_PANMI|nr:acyl-coenzyme A thioesterase 13-like [Panicum miliaceum]
MLLTRQGRREEASGVVEYVHRAVTAQRGINYSCKEYYMIAEPGRVLCSLRVRAPLTVGVICRPPTASHWAVSRAQDAKGRWHAGAAGRSRRRWTACAPRWCSRQRARRRSPSKYAVSYFSPAHHNEEVGMEGRVASRKGKLTAAACSGGDAQGGVRRAGGSRQAWTIPSGAAKMNRSSRL